MSILEHAIEMAKSMGLSINPLSCKRIDEADYLRQ